MPAAAVPALRVREPRPAALARPAGDLEAVAVSANDARGSVSLRALREGERGWVAELAEPGSPVTARLVVMGILPGAELELLQRFPAFVFRIGCAEFAVDAALAERIRVRRGEPRDFTDPSRRPHARDARLPEEPAGG
jgi:Fe2+ transport system protein FeoA